MVTNLMPGPIETQFGEISGMDKTSLFRKMAKAGVVAEAGYKGMLRGKIDVISGVSFLQRIMFALVPFLPQKIVLKQVRKMQETEL